MMVDSDLLNQITLKNIDLEEELERSHKENAELKREMKLLKEEYERSFEILNEENESLQRKILSIISTTTTTTTKSTSLPEETIIRSDPIERKTKTTQQKEWLSLWKFICHFLIYSLQKDLAIEKQFLDSLLECCLFGESQLEMIIQLHELFSNLKSFNIEEEPFLGKLMCCALLDEISMEFSCPNLRRYLKNSKTHLPKGLFDELRSAVGKTASLIALDEKFATNDTWNSPLAQENTIEEQEATFERILKYIPLSPAKIHDFANEIEDLKRKLQESEEKSQLYQLKVKKLTDKCKELEESNAGILSTNATSLSNSSPINTTTSSKVIPVFSNEMILVEKYEKAISLMHKNYLLYSNANSTQPKHSKNSHRLHDSNYALLAKLCNKAIFSLNSCHFETGAL